MTGSVVDATTNAILALVRSPVPYRPEEIREVVTLALEEQRRRIVYAIGKEARAAACGRYPRGCRSLTYDAGMRRAAWLLKQPIVAP